VLFPDDTEPWGWPIPSSRPIENLRPNDVVGKGMEAVCDPIRSHARPVSIAATLLKMSYSIALLDYGKGLDDCCGSKRSLSDVS
jgi:hypothetical protein